MILFFLSGARGLGLGLEVERESRRIQQVLRGWDVLLMIVWLANKGRWVDDLCRDAKGMVGQWISTMYLLMRAHTQAPQEWLGQQDVSVRRQC